MWKRYYTVSSIDEALNILDGEREKARIIAGGTDLVLELKNGQHKNIETLIDVTRIRGLDQVEVEDRVVKFRPAFTHNQCVASGKMQQYGFPLVRAAYSVGAPQIRNVGTIVGNLVTASPANDTITPLVALDAKLKIRSKKREYLIPLADFYKGVRKTVLKPDEMVVEVQFPCMRDGQKGEFIKYLLRETHAISVANVCALLSFENNRVTDAVITLGSVAPTIVRSPSAEEVLINTELTEEMILRASAASKKDMQPIDDIRSSEKYRSHIIPVLLKRALESIRQDNWNKFDYDPVLLWGNKKQFTIPIDKTVMHDGESEIATEVNGNEKIFKNGQTNTILALIREQAKLTGSKEGCGEGECGSCTMHFNGLPVLTCLLPAPKLHHNAITTIEGLQSDGKLDAVQQAFIDAGAVQCGFCTPGFIMSAVKLIEERPNPTEMDIKQGLAGNICRCTGYYSIINAVEMAAKEISTTNGEE